jgi:hypothetical protein
MLDSLWTSNETIDLFTDSAGGENMGFGIYFQGKWAQACWPGDWANNGVLSDITFCKGGKDSFRLRRFFIYDRNNRLIIGIKN